MFKKNKIQTKYPEIREFTNDNELLDFCDQTWGKYISSLDHSILMLLLAEQGHSLKEKKQCTQVQDKIDIEIIETIRKKLPEFPPLPYDVLIYRGGPMNIPERPYLPASFFKNDSLKVFAHNNTRLLHKIVLRKGSHIIPSLYLTLENCKVDGRLAEHEVIIDVSCLHKKTGYYEYY